MLWYAYGHSPQEDVKGDMTVSPTLRVLYRSGREIMVVTSFVGSSGGDECVNDDPSDTISPINS